MTDKYPQYYAELKSRDFGTKSVHLKSEGDAVNFFSKFGDDLMAIVKDDGNGNIRTCFPKEKIS